MGLIGAFRAADLPIVKHQLRGGAGKAQDQDKSDGGEFKHGAGVKTASRSLSISGRGDKLSAMGRTKMIKRFALGFAMALALCGAAGADPAPASDQVVAQARAALDQSSTVIGSPRANVTIVEFFDYTCPYCKAVEPRLEALLKSDKGVRLVLKEFPILTPQSLVAAKAGLAAARQGKYAAYHQALMRYEGPLSDEVIFDTARRAGVNLARLRADMIRPEISDELIANFNLARGLRLFQTPSFIVGNHVLTGLSAEIDFPREVAAARRR